MEKVSLKISEGLASKFGNEIKSVLSRTNDKTIEVTILAKAEDNSLIYEEAYALAKQPKTKVEINILDAEEFFEKLMDNDIESLERLRLSDVCYDNNRFISPIKALVDSGKVFGQKEPLEMTSVARQRFAQIDSMKHDAVKKLYGAIITSANAALLARGYSIPPTNDLPQYLKECFVKHDLLEKKYTKICERIIYTYKKANDNQPFELWEFSQLSYETEIFIERMKTLLR